MERQYRTWGYPWVPLVFVLMSALLVVNTLFEAPRDALFGLCIVSLGVPAYYFWKREGTGSANACEPRRIGAMVMGPPVARRALQLRFGRNADTGGSSGSYLS